MYKRRAWKETEAEEEEEELGKTVLDEGFPVRCLI
jgi:hypothetical protein